VCRPRGGCGGHSVSYEYLANGEFPCIFGSTYPFWDEAKHLVLLDSFVVGAVPFDLFDSGSMPDFKIHLLLIALVPFVL
jgi:hypothetical protein